MIIKKTLGNIDDYPSDNRKVESVYLEWFELEKKRMRKTLESGEEIGICLDSEQNNLHEGDVLYVDDKRVIIVEIVSCELTVIEVTTMKEMGCLCFELGNRHLPLAIEEDKVTVPYDEPTFYYLDKMGFSLERTEGKFSHFTECHAHGHHENHAHSQESENAQANIYDYAQYAHTGERNNE